MRNVVQLLAAESYNVSSSRLVSFGFVGVFSQFLRFFCSRRSLPLKLLVALPPSLTHSLTHILNYSFSLLPSPSLFHSPLPLQCSLHSHAMASSEVHKQVMQTHFKVSE